MTNIVSRVLLSELEPIGANLHALSKLGPLEVSAEYTETVEAVKLSYKDSGSEGAAEMANICSALAISEIELRDDAWVAKPEVGPGNCDAVAQVADVKFIFEKAHEKIIVIPHQGALEFALQDPPLKEGDYLNAMARDKVLQMQNDLKTKMEDSDVPIGEAAVVMELFDALVSRYFPVVDTVGTLYQQLGSYTCRQCG